MASIFDIPLRETGGPDALTAFEYQHRIAVGELLRLASTSDCDLIEIDSHDDILIRATGMCGPRADFIQVKAHASGIWTLSDIYRDEKKGGAAIPKASTSLAAKQLKRAIGDDAVSFKVVTKSDVSSDLAVLKKSAADRNPDKVKELKGKIIPRFSHLSFPNNRTVSDWIDTMLWQVTGSEQAVDDRNLHVIDEVVLSHFNRTLSPDQKQDIYRALLSRVRTAAATKEPREEKSCTKSQLITWLRDYCIPLPVNLPPDIHTLIDKLLLLAHERCIGRWRNAGVKFELAKELAADVIVGSDTVKWVLEQSEDFLWISGQFGTGKSLAVDRVYQDALCRYRQGLSNRIPVFLEAKELTRPLSEEILLQAEKIGNFLLQGVYVVIDGADEKTHQKARELIQDASVYARANLGSKVIITSTVLEVNGHEPKILPPISREEADRLLKRVAGKYTNRHFIFDGRFASDLMNPFFIIQCARFGTELSRADLVRRMVEEAIKQVEVAIQSAEELLADLARWQLDNGSPLIPEKVIGSARASIGPVLQTRLIEKHGDHYVFTIECVAQWFAAQAIEKGLVSTLDLSFDLERLERWQFAIAMALSQADADQGNRIMTPLAKSQPAIGSLVLRDGLLEWGRNRPTRQVSAAEVACRLRSAMQGWKEGFEPISSVSSIFPICANGELKKIAATCKNGFYTVQWHERLELSAESEMTLEPMPGESSETWCAQIVDHPAWAWKTSHSHIKGKIREAFDTKLCTAASDRLLLEMAWSEGCSLMCESNFCANSLSTAKLDERIHHGFTHTAQRLILRQHLSYLLLQGVEQFVAPYPQSDQIPCGHWIWMYFSHDQMVKRTASVYYTAMLAYREVLEAMIPKMAARLPRYAAWPFDLKGIVSFSEANGEGYILRHTMIPLPPGAEGKADYSPGSEWEGDALLKNWGKHDDFSHIGRSPWYLSSCSISALSIWGANPAAEIVQRWIKSDLKAVGWD